MSNSPESFRALINQETIDWLLRCNPPKHYELGGSVSLEDLAYSAGQQSIIKMLEIALRKNTYSPRK